jgi:hypothetical protein
MLLQEIDEALVNRLKGAITIPADESNTQQTPVPVVISTPDRYMSPAVWPAITIWMYDTIPDYYRQVVHSPLGTVSLSEDKKSAEIKTPSQSLDVYYQIDTFAMQAIHDRIIQKAMWEVFPLRFGLRVLDSDNLTDGKPTPNLLWMIFDSYRTADTVTGETKTFHKIWTWRICTDLDVGPSIKVPTAWKGVRLGSPKDLTKTSVGINLL